jgi:hypothetical protein
MTEQKIQLNERPPCQRSVHNRTKKRTTGVARRSGYERAESCQIVEMKRGGNPKRF